MSEAVRPGSPGGTAGDPSDRYLELLEKGLWREAEALLVQLPAPERERLRALSDSLLETLGRDGAATLLRPGARLDDLVLVRELGRGGMGMVWEAEQPAIGRRVAVKLLYPVYALFDRHQRRFRREARAVARLRHPNVAAIYDLGEVQATPYIVQELVPGGHSLRDELEALSRTAAEASAGARRAPPPPGHARRMAKLFLQVAGALEHAHGSGVLHRDLKPSNLLLLPEDQVKVVDFGLAALDDEASSEAVREASGTLLYMAPEARRGGTVADDPRVDVYALGVSLLEALVLPGALAPKDAELWRDALAAGKPPDPAALRPGIPADLAAIALAAAEPRAERRLAGARAVAAELERFLAGEPVHCRPSYRRRRTLWHLRRARVPLGAAALASALALALALPRGDAAGLAPFSSPEAAERHLSAARERTLAGELGPAQRHLEQARLAWRGDAVGAPLLRIASEELVLLLRLGDERRAEELLEALPLARELARRNAREQAELGADPLERVEAGLALGLFALLEEDPSGAERELWRALGVAAAALDEGHPLVLQLRRWRAEALFRGGDYHTAHLEFVALHDLHRELHGDAHVLTLTARADVGRACLVRDHPGEAVAHLEAAWPALGRSLGRGHAESLRAGLALGRARMRSGDLPGARRTLEGVLRALREQAPAGSRSLLEVRSELAGLLELQDERVAAERLHREIYAAHRAHRGEGHATTLHARASWALALARLAPVPEGDPQGPDAARELLEAARELARAPGVEEARARLDTHRLARELGRLLGAEEAAARLAGAPELARDGAFLRANAWLGGGRAADVLELIDEICRSEIAAAPPGTPRLAARRTMAELLLAQGRVHNARSWIRRAWIDTPIFWTGARVDQLMLLDSLDEAALAAQAGGQDGREF